MSALDWLRTKRDLIAGCDAQLAVINGQRDRLVNLSARLDEQKALTAQARRLAEQRADQLVLIRIEAMKLREQIRRLETGDVLNAELAAFINADSQAERGEP